MGIFITIILGIVMQAIDLSKVLLITNADIAQSTTDADYYVAARGLNAAHRLSFNFGTSNAILTATQLKSSGGPACVTTGYTGLMFAPAVASYIKTNGIQAVILSTYTPTRVDPQIVSLPGAVYTLSSCAGSARYMNFWSLGSPFQYFDALNPLSSTRATIEQIIANVPQVWQIPDNTNVPNYSFMTNLWGQIPHGRLGNPDWSSGTIAELAVRASITSNSCVVYATANGLTQENVKHTLGQHAFTQSLSYDPGATGAYMSVSRNTTAFNWAKRIAIPAVANMGTDYSMGQIGGEDVIVLPAPLFGLSIGVPFNNNTTPGFLRNEFTCEAGAWGYVWTSFAGYFGDAVLYNGGSAAMLSFGEPYADGLPLANEFFIYLSYYKVPMMLAAFLANSNNMGATVCGDPLYAPYKSTATLPPVVSSSFMFPT